MALLTVDFGKTGRGDNLKCECDRGQRLAL